MIAVDLQREGGESAVVFTLLAAEHNRAAAAGAAPIECCLDWDRVIGVAVTNGTVLARVAQALRNTHTYHAAVVYFPHRGRPQCSCSKCRQQQQRLAGILLFIPRFGNGENLD